MESPFFLLGFVTNNKHFWIIVEGGGEDVGLAAIFYFVLCAQFADGEREVASGEVGFWKWFEEGFCTLFVEWNHLFYLESTPREVVV